jgi:serine/threonine protein kinase
MVAAELWDEISPPEGSLEQSALSLLRGALPTIRPLRLWSGFEFMAPDGASFDVDLLALGPHGVYLIKLAAISQWGDLGRWTWLSTQAGQRIAMDNPVPEAQRVAQKLRELLHHHTGGPRDLALPIEGVAMICDPSIQLEGIGLPSRVVFPPGAGEGRPLLTELLRRGQLPGENHRRLELSVEAVERFVDAMGRADLGKSQKYERIGDYRRGRLLETGAGHQDYLAAPLRGEGAAKRARAFFVASPGKGPRVERLHKAALRELTVLRQLKHPNILQVEDPGAFEAGMPPLVFRDRPTLLLEHHVGEQRLDLLLASRGRARGEGEGAVLSARARFAILTQVAEAVRFAHNQGIIHRALSPQAVLVSWSGDRPHARVYNWHTAAAQDQQQTGTLHVQDYVDDAAQVFLAPEVAQGRWDHRADIFGLGALALTLFSGRSPASSPGELWARLRRDDGLQLSADVDAAPSGLEEAIYDATRAQPNARLGSVEELLKRLQDAEAELSLPPSPRGVNPLEAQPGDLLPEGYTVRRRLGSGSSAVALLVQKATHDRELVLKIALEPSQGAQIAREAEVLRRLERSQGLVVRLLGQTQLRHGEQRLDALELSFAGETLREHQLRAPAEGEEARLARIERFGRSLCQALWLLEERGVLHRDLKPSNLGVLHGEAVLFDFSLSNHPRRDLKAGTQAYLDPLLTERGEADHEADRYAAALTLYEMLTRELPSAPAGEVQGLPGASPLVLKETLFPARARSGLSEFFGRALSASLSRRFKNAVEMEEAWRAACAVGQAAPARVSQEELIQNSSPETALSALGVSAAALEALEALGAVSVRALVELSSQRLHFASGAVASAKGELVALQKALQARHPGLSLETAQRRGGLAEASPETPLEELARMLLEVASSAERGLWQEALGQGAAAWPALGELAPRGDQEAASRLEALDQLVEKVQVHPVMERVGEVLRRILRQCEGMALDRELTDGLLGLWGSQLRDEGARERVARVVVLASLWCARREAEPWLWMRRLQGRAFFAQSAALLERLEDLGQMADLLSEDTTPRSPLRAWQELAGELSRHELEAPSQSRLLRVAVAASQHAALSSKDEIYPKGLSAVRALQLSHAALIDQRLKPQELTQRVRSRYAEMAPLPSSALDLEALLQAAQLPMRREGDLFVWAHGDKREQVSGHLSSARGEGHPDEAEQRHFLSGLADRERLGGFVALTLHPERAAQAPAALLRLLPGFTHRSLDALWLSVMRAQAQALGIEWAAILQADSPEAPAEDRGRLSYFVRHHVFPPLEEALLAERSPLLLSNPGLLARFAAQGGEGLLATLRARAGCPGAPSHIWLLIPSDRRAQKSARIDDLHVPNVLASEVHKAPEDWPPDPQGTPHGPQDRQA